MKIWFACNWTRALNSLPREKLYTRSKFVTKAKVNPKMTYWTMKLLLVHVNLENCTIWFIAQVQFPLKWPFLIETAETRFAFGWNLVSKNTLSLQFFINWRTFPSNRTCLMTSYLRINSTGARFIFPKLLCMMVELYDSDVLSVTFSFLPFFLAVQLILVAHLKQVLLSPRMIHLMLWQVWDELSHKFDHQRWKVISKAQINKNSFEVFLTEDHCSDHIPWTVQYKLNMLLISQKQKRFTTRGVNSRDFFFFFFFFLTSPNPTQ